MDLFQIIVLVFFVLVAFLLVGMVLIQDEQGDGLAGMFGGGSSSTFGSRAGNVLTKTTSILGALFIIVALGLAVLFKQSDAGDVAAAARQAGGTTEWWNAEPAPAPAVPAVPAETAPTTGTATDAPANSSGSAAPVSSSGSAGN